MQQDAVNAGLVKSLTTLIFCELMIQSQNPQYAVLAKNRQELEATLIY